MADWNFGAQDWGNNQFGGGSTMQGGNLMGTLGGGTNQGGGFNIGSMSDWFGSGKKGNTGMFGNVAGGVGSLMQGLGAWGDFKNAKNQAATEKAFANRNLANQATLTNRSIMDQQRSRAASSGQFDRTTPEGRANLEQSLEKYKNTVSGAPV